jgi:hypothetical protein
MTVEDHDTTIANVLGDQAAFMDLLARLLRVDLDQTAVEAGAMANHPSAKIKNAATLLQLILSYVLLDNSMEATTDLMADRVSISRQAFRERFERSRLWMATLIRHLLTASQPPPSTALDGLTVMLVDGCSVTAESAPQGAQANNAIHRYILAMSATDMMPRHLLYDLQRPNAGESLNYLPVSPNQLWVADAGYTTTRAFDHVEAHDSYLLSYYRPNLNYYIHPIGNDCFDFRQKLTEALPEEGDLAEWTVYINSSRRRQSDQGRRRPVRLIAQRISARGLQRRQAQRRAMKGSTDPEVMALDAFVILVTNLEPGRGSALELLRWYRLRWQLELEFRRQQSAIGLKRPPTRKPQTTQAWLLAKLLGVMLTHRMLHLLQHGEFDNTSTQPLESDVEPNPLAHATATPPAQRADGGERMQWSPMAVWPWRIWRWAWLHLLGTLTFIPPDNLSAAFERLCDHISRTDTPKRWQGRTIAKLMEAVEPGLHEESPRDIIEPTRQMQTAAPT